MRLFLKSVDFYSDSKPGQSYAQENQAGSGSMTNNIFESVDRGLRRIGEVLEDTGAMLDDAIDSTWRPGSTRNTEKQCTTIFSHAQEALGQGDRQEAEHQLNREIYLTQKSLPPGNRYELAGQAGLASVREGYSPALTSFMIDRALLNLADYDQPVRWSAGFPELETNVQEISQSETTRSAAEFHCNELLGEKAFGAALNGDAKATQYHLQRGLYLARKYIPGNDSAEWRAEYALHSLNHGKQPAEVLEILEPMLERWKEQVDRQKAIAP